MPNLRHERVRELLKREIGEAIRREFHVNDVGIITVNDVDVAGDFKSAVVFISILGNPAQQKRGLTVLNENRIRLQGLIARAVVLKFTPTLKFVADDSIVRGKVRVRRRKDIIYEGILQSLRRFQDEVNEVRAGMECGLRIEGYSEFQVGDAIECYNVEKVAAKL